MKLISIIQKTKSGILGFVEDKGKYHEFFVKPGGEIQIEKELIGPYESYDLFADIYNKFDPDIEFFDAPVVIKSNDYAGIDEAYKNHLGKNK